MAELVLQNLSKRFGGLQAVNEFNLEVPEGKILSLIGPNGAGKSTTLLTIFGVQPAAKGEIRYKDRAIQNLRPEQVAALGVAQTPEGRQIFPRMSTLENLQMGAFLRRDAEAVAEDLEWVYSLFPVLKERTTQLGGTLSGGEQQMLAIGRSLTSRPALLMLDEPSLGLAPKLVERIFETLLEINRKGTTIFLVEQNAHMALSISDTGYVMETGRVILTDNARALLQNDDVKKAYLGE